jgi:hypothetical protein
VPVNTATQQIKLNLVRNSAVNYLKTSVEKKNSDVILSEAVGFFTERFAFSVVQIMRETQTERHA